MRLWMSVLLVILWSATAQARNALPNDIRQVHTDSTDVFEVLSRLQQAQNALSQRNFEDAINGFESVLFHDPNLDEARTGLRQSLIGVGDYKRALTYIDDAYPVESAIIRIQLGQVPDPDSLISKTLKTHSDPRLWNLRGKLQDKRGEFLSARQSYAMAGLAGARPGLPENNIGQSHWLAGEITKALSAFEKAVAADPYDRLFDNNRRRALIRLGRTQDAIAGLDARRAGHFLAQAGDKAKSENEIKLAKLLYRKSLDIAPRHNPVTAEKLARLKQ